MRILRDQPTSKWPFLHLGEGFGEFGAFRPTTVGGFPSAPVAEGVCRSYEALVEFGRPGVCRITGVDGAGSTTMYDRLWLPVADGDGPISAFLTIADITLGLTLPDGRIVGAGEPEARTMQPAAVDGVPGHRGFR